MLANLEEIQYKDMTPIQEMSIPFILQNRDILAQAKTGSGKTAAFGIGLLHNLNVDRYRVQSLVLCPTRELAEQVTGELRRLAKFRHNIKMLKLTGGMPMYKQEISLKHQAHIIVGTPGRILKLLQRGSLVLDELKNIILDEADRMLDMGFIDQVRDIVKFAPIKRQTLLFSATFPEGIKKLSKSILKNPKEITVESKHDTTIISQKFYKVFPKDKGRGLSTLLRKHKPESTIVFCNTKEACRNAERELQKYSIESLALHGDLEQKDRTEVLVRFANKSCNVLVATDVAARGLDIENLGAVINYDLPFDTETYVHRIGRTGRAGNEGMALSLLVPGEEFRLDYINSYFKNEFTDESLELQEPIENDDFLPQMITLSINGGRKNKISAGDILGALTSDKSISGDHIGKIDRMDYLTFVAVHRSVYRHALKLLQSGAIKGKRFKAMAHQ